MTCYIDSSAVLRILLNSKGAFKDLEIYKTIGSSELLLIECNRVIDRYRMENILADEEIAILKENLKIFTDGMYIIEINQAVKTRAAESFPSIVGTLDAIHLATMLLWRDINPDMILITHDKQMAICARALGIKVCE